MAKFRKKDAGAPQAAGDTTVANPDRERVAMRAYELYLARGASDGQAMEDWLLAERELLAPQGAGHTTAAVELPPSFASREK